MSVHHVLGVLEDDERRLWSTFDCAVSLAAEQAARLTLVKTTDPGRLMRWFAPSALQSMCVSAQELDFRTIASHTLARAAEFVPGSIPVTTVLLGEDTTGCLLAMLRNGPYDALVITEALLNRRLRRELRRLGIRTVAVPRRPAAPAIPSADTAHHAHSGVQT